MKSFFNRFPNWNPLYFSYRFIAQIFFRRKYSALLTTNKRIHLLSISFPTVWPLVINGPAQLRRGPFLSSHASLHPFPYLRSAALGRGQNSHVWLPHVQTIAVSWYYVQNELARRYCWHLYYNSINHLLFYEYYLGAIKIASVSRSHVENSFILPPTSVWLSIPSFTYFHHNFG